VSSERRRRSGEGRCRRKRRSKKKKPHFTRLVYDGSSSLVSRLWLVVGGDPVRPAAGRAQKVPLSYTVRHIHTSALRGTSNDKIQFDY
jgi:hypothetical protein